MRDPPSIAARWIDLGNCPAAAFHASYVALAKLNARGTLPIVVSATPQAHVSIGQSQHRDRAVVANPGVPVCRRALGGGTVWVDEDQLCIVLIAPAHLLPRGRADLLAEALCAAADTLRGLGLPGEVRERDIWVRGRKICGSAGATIDGAQVAGFSFMRRFARDRFAACVALPCERTRAWLGDALRFAMTDWMSEGEWPAGDRLIEVFQEHLRARLAWCLHSSVLDAGELRQIAAIGADDDDGWVESAVTGAAGAMRLNASSFLSTSRTAAVCRDRLVIDGHVVKVMTHALADH